MAACAPTAGPFYGTFIEHWPAGVCALSMPHIGRVLSDTDAELLASCEGASRTLGPSRFSRALSDWLALVFDRFRGGVFLRLGGRSFVTPDQAAHRVGSVAAALRLLSMPGDRAARMARRCRLAGRPVWLYARQWRPIAPAEEVRLIVRRGAGLVASQLHHRQSFPDLLRRAESVAMRVGEIGVQLAAVLHLPEVVADVWVPPLPGAAAELIELNPMMAATGRALLAAGSFDLHPRALHLLGADGSVLRWPLHNEAPI